MHFLAVSDILKPLSQHILQYMCILFIYQRIGAVYHPIVFSVQAVCMK